MRIAKWNFIVKKALESMVPLLVCTDSSLDRTLFLNWIESRKKGCPKRGKGTSFKYFITLLTREVASKKIWGGARVKNNLFALRAHQWYLVGEKLFSSIYFHQLLLPCLGHLRSSLRWHDALQGPSFDASGTTEIQGDWRVCCIRRKSSTTLSRTTIPNFECWFVRTTLFCLFLN